jgi:hypothetical protein
MQINAQGLTQHAARIGDAASAINPPGERQGVQDHPPRLMMAAQGLRQDPAQIAIGDLATGQVHVHGDACADRRSGG